MLAIFLISYSGAAVSSHGIKAFILIAALTCDVGLGMWSIVHHDSPGPVPQSCSGHSQHYTYWGLPLSQTGAPVLGLVSAILGWDLVHVVLSRRTVECWARMCSWGHRQMLRRRWLSSRGHRRGRSGPWWFNSRQSALEKRGWTCVSVS
ncbi:hypothetical protein FocnCong_v021682 [Fusarium oxysporum f. sp. conglutinans]|nr:hypothetical protein FocnCong_v021682 [Fusarium oxysporum f. sp. conglutinans]